MLERAGGQNSSLRSRPIVFPAKYIIFQNGRFLMKIRREILLDPEIADVVYSRGGLEISGKFVMEADGFLDVSTMLHCCVYALLQRDVVVYIGKTKQPLTRLYSHAHARGKLEPWKAGYTTRKKGFKFDGIWIRPCMLAQLDQLEVDMIRKYQPKYNVRMREAPPPLDLSELLKEIVPMRGPPVEAPIRRRV